MAVFQTAWKLQTIREGLRRGPPEPDPADSVAYSGVQDTGQVTAATAQGQRRKWKTLMATL